MSNGLVTQIIGAVIDVEFDKDNIPKVYEAIKLTDTGTVLEVQQQLGDGIVRAIAMGTTEGLKRGLTAERTNAPISVPVGEKTLGRIMDVLGNPIDESNWGRRANAHSQKAAKLYGSVFIRRSS